MHDVTEVIAQDLKFDVPRRLDVLFDVHVAHTKRSLRLTLRGLERMCELTGRTDDAHAAAATPGRGLDDDRITDVLGCLDRLFFGFNRAIASRQNRDAGLFHHTTRPRLV